MYMLYVHMYVYVLVYIYMCVCVCVLYMCMCTCMCKGMYIHTPLGTTVRQSLGYVVTRVTGKIIY